MREKILALVEELKRRKADGDEYVYVSDESVKGLQNAVYDLQNPALGQEASTANRTASTNPATASTRARATYSPPSHSQANNYGAPSSTESSPAARNDDFEMKPYRKPTAPEQTQPEVTEPALPPPPVFDLPSGSKLEQWEWLRDRVVNCPTCNANLNEGKQVVFGNGSIDADIFFCGEAPGADEESIGIPFVGKAGQLLMKIIAAMGLKREDVYIGNIMNWRPRTGRATGNRPPTEEEMAFCLPYLKAQVEVVKPKVIVALGNTAVTGLMGPDKNRRLGAIRGKWFDFNGTPMLPTYHPSYVLRYGSVTTKRQIWEDMLEVMEKVNLPISEKQRGYFSA